MNEELISELEMYFNQIISLCDIMLEVDKYTMPNTLTLRDIAEQAISKIEKQEKNKMIAFNTK